MCSDASSGAARFNDGLTCGSWQDHVQKSNARNETSQRFQEFCILKIKPDLDDEQSIIERAKSDPEQFGVLFERHYPSIFAYIHRYCQMRPASVDGILPGARFVERWLRGLTRDPCGRRYCRGLPLHAAIHSFIDTLGVCTPPQSSRPQVSSLPTSGRRAKDRKLIIIAGRCGRLANR